MTRLRKTDVREALQTLRKRLTQYNDMTSKELREAFENVYAEEVREHRPNWLNECSREFLVSRLMFAAIAYAEMSLDV